MICPGCGANMKPTDRICRACLFMPEAGRVVAVEPPRMSAGRAAPAAHRLGLWRNVRLRLGRIEYRPRMPVWFPPVAGIVPGLGHLLRRQVRIALLVFLLVGGCLLGGALAGGLAAWILIPFATAIHACSMVHLMTGIGSDTLFSRLVRTTFLLVALGVVVYGPLMGRVAPPERGDTITTTPIGAMAYNAAQFLSLLTGIGITIAIAVVVGFLVHVYADNPNKAGR